MALCEDTDARTAELACLHTQEPAEVQLINTLSAPGSDISDEVDRIAIAFAVLGGWTSIASSLEVAMYMWSARRQVARLRQRFLEAALNQEQVRLPLLAALCCDAHGQALRTGVFCAAGLRRRAAALVCAHTCDVLDPHRADGPHDW